MGTSSLDQKSKDRRQAEKPCWSEILLTAFGGYCISDLHLESMFDHLERMP